MRRADLVAAAALLFAAATGVSAWMDRPGTVTVPAGRQDAGSYLVQPLTQAEPIALPGGDTLQPVAQFETRGRVLNIERFKPYQSLANWIPGLRPATHDIGLGYGPMTDTANVARFRFAHEGTTQGLRALFPRPREPMSQRDWDALAPHITNVHVIPADAAVLAQIRRIRNGELVTLRGQLVNLRDAQGRIAMTSVTAGDRDCEIVYVTAVEIGRL
ncbi:MAG: hypothetical protein MUC68_01235 [Burkholderiaceae bacterium]|jgi:hypothetical protein|nr:hypothetical protein [Burkholderiaceae bacterium]